MKKLISSKLPKFTFQTETNHYLPTHNTVDPTSSLDRVYLLHLQTAVEQIDGLGYKPQNVTNLF